MTATSPLPTSNSVAGSGTEAGTNWVIGVMVPVKWPSAMNVSPVTNAVTLVGSRLADVSMPRTLNCDTPSPGKKSCTPASNDTTV
jgi:hypothetical protein